MAMDPVPSGEHRIALFIDFENLALGMKQSPGKKFDIQLVLDRILEKGRILFKIAYADWSRHREYKQQLHEVGIELIEIPKKRLGGKNSADIRMVVDAMDMAYSKEHLDTFALVTGDSDFSPLVSKLRENNRMVVGLGIKAASSPLLIENCDDFIYYDDLLRQVEQVTKSTEKPQKDMPKVRQEALDLLVKAVRGLMREGRDVVWASMVKQAIKRKKPSFDESYHGYKSFSALLLEAERQKLLKLEKDQKSGSLIVRELL